MIGPCQQSKARCVDVTRVPFPGQRQRHTDLVNPNVYYMAALINCLHVTVAARRSRGKSSDSYTDLLF